MVSFSDAIGKGFAGYVDFVTSAFGNYTTDMLLLVEEGNRVSGKMRFQGTHRREMFGVAPIRPAVPAKPVLSSQSASNAPVIAWLPVNAGLDSISSVSS